MANESKPHPFPSQLVISVTGLWYSQEDWPSAPKAALTLQWQGLRGLQEVVVPASHLSPAVSFLASLDCCAAAMVQSWAHPFCWIPLLPASPRRPICEVYSSPRFALTSLQEGFPDDPNDDFITFIILALLCPYFSIVANLYTEFIKGHVCTFRPICSLWFFFQQL